MRHKYYCLVTKCSELREMKIAVLVSGKGTGLQAIVDHVRLGVLLNSKIIQVVSNNPDAEAIKKALSSNIEARFVEGVAGRRFSSPEEREKERRKFDDNVSSMFLKNGVELVVCAGFNQVLSDVFISRYSNRIMNIHPAYNVEKFGGSGMVGLKVHEAVINAGENLSGCTIHYIDSIIDRGPVIIRVSVPVFKNDTPERLADRVAIVEHRTYPKAMQLHVDGRIKVKGRNAVLNLDAVWERDWRRRQERYLEYQTSMWKSHGKDINEIFKPLN